MSPPKWKGRPAEAPDPVILSSSSVPEYSNDNGAVPALIEPFITVGEAAQRVIDDLGRRITGRHCNDGAGR